MEIDGNLVYKATVVKNSFSANPLSKDRLKRIRGLSRVEQNASTSDELATMVMPGDPILVKGKDNLQIGVIKSLRKANEKCKMLELSELSVIHTIVEVQQIQLHDYEGKYIWKDEVYGNTFTVYLDQIVTQFNLF